MAGTNRKVDQVNETAAWGREFSSLMIRMHPLDFSGETFSPPPRTVAA
jgi:hypothetical protein